MGQNGCYEIMNIGFRDGHPDMGSRRPIPTRHVWETGTIRSMTGFGYNGHDTTIHENSNDFTELSARSLLKAWLAANL